MREALNGFVIRGVASNIPFQAALLAHPKFVAGDFNTGFIAEHYAQGFRAEDVPHDDPDFLVALAAAAYRRYRERAAGISGQLAGHGVRIGNDFVVVVKGAAGEHTHVPVHDRRPTARSRVTVGGRAYAIDSDWQFGGIRASGTLQRPALHRAGRTPRPVAARRPQRPAHRRAGDDARAPPSCCALMPFKAPPDMSKFLLSPMPGLLVDVAVQPGQTVQAGERLAVIEAMKMENILTAAQDGTVARGAGRARARAWRSTSRS